MSKTPWEAALGKGGNAAENSIKSFAEASAEKEGEVGALALDLREKSSYRRSSGTGKGRGGARRGSSSNKKGKKKVYGRLESEGRL